MQVTTNTDGTLTITAAPTEAWTIINGLEAAYEALTAAARALDNEALASPLLESACRYQSLADRLRDELDQ